MFYRTFARTHIILFHRLSHSYEILSTLLVTEQCFIFRPSSHLRPHTDYSASGARSDLGFLARRWEGQGQTDLVEWLPPSDPGRWVTLNVMRMAGYFSYGSRLTLPPDGEGASWWARKQQELMINSSRARSLCQERYH